MKTRKISIVAIAVLFVAALVGGCRDENMETVGVCPIVVSTTPANSAVSVPLEAIVTVTFNTPLNPATVTQEALTVLAPGETGGRVSETKVFGAMTYNAETFTIQFVPATKLKRNTTYTGTVATSVKDPLGNALQTPYIWTFSTSAGPTVTSTNPANLATSVPLSSSINAVFSEPMNGSTITTSSFVVTTAGNQVAGTVSYVGTTATFTPTGNLLSGSTYTATITSSVANQAGTPLQANYQWTFTTNPPLGPVGVNLKSVERFGIIAGVGVSNNAGFSEIRNLDVGISPGVRSSITGFPPAIIVNGDMFASDDPAPAGVAAMLTQAKQDLTDAYLFAEGATSPAPATVAGDLGGTTLAPGIYKSTSTLMVQSGNLTLDAQGDANAVWIFQIASDFTTVGGAGGNIILSGGAQARNVYWQVGSSATIGDNTSFKGNVLALTSITMNANAVAVGRMLARNGSVVMTSTNIIERP